MKKLSNKHNRDKGFTLIELSIVIVIIGTIIGIVFRSTSLIRPGRVAGAALKTANSTIGDIGEGPILWFETTLKDNVKIDSSNKVTRWKNLGFHSLRDELFLENLTEADRPTLEQESINGLPAIYFNGSNTFLTLSREISCIGCKPHTVFIVAKPDSSENTGTADLIAQGQLGSSGTYSMLLSIVNNQTRGYLKSIESISVATAAPTGNLFISSQIYNGKTLRSGTNGLLSNTLNISTLRDTRYQVFIGSRSDLISINNLQGHIGEIIVYDFALNNDEFNEVILYLVNKWGAEAKY